MTEPTDHAGEPQASGDDQYNLLYGTISSALAEIGDAQLARVQPVLAAVRTWRATLPGADVLDEDDLALVAAWDAYRVGQHDLCDQDALAECAICYQPWTAIQRPNPACPFHGDQPWTDEPEAPDTDGELRAQLAAATDALEANPARVPTIAEARDMCARLLQDGPSSPPSATLPAEPGPEVRQATPNPTQAVLDAAIAYIDANDPDDDGQFIYSRQAAYNNLKAAADRWYQEARR